MSKRYLVTGANGFVGANLIRTLHGWGEEVHGIVRCEVGWRLRDLQSHKGPSFHVCDLREEFVVLDLIDRIRPDVVFHCAAFGAYPFRDGKPFQNDSHVMVGTNVLGTLHILNACAESGVDTVVYTGSSSEYGLSDVAMNEFQPMKPQELYGVTKACGTMLCQLYSRVHGLRTVILRLFSVYGPWEEPSRLVPTLMRAAMEKVPARLFQKEAVRDFVYVEDVLGACMKAAEGRGDPGAVYNVGSGQESSVGSVARLVSRVAGGKEPIWVGAYRVEPRHWMADTTQARSGLGWTATTSLQEGLTKTYEWWRAVGASVCGEV